MPISGPPGSRAPDGDPSPLPGDPHERRWSLGPAESAVERRLASWAGEDVVGRIWRRDPSFWPQAPATQVADRLGWLLAPEQSAALVEELEAFAEGAVRDGIDQVVLLGMGGSSLAAEVIARTLPRRRRGTSFVVLDSTHPRAVGGLAERVAVDRALFLVSSKSGTTLEPNAFFRFFWGRAKGRLAEPGRRFVAITDLGTPLEQLARERGFRTCFAAPSDVGGRYSALTAFGLVPAALLGVDLRALLASARAMVARCAEPADGAGNPGLRLGAALGELACGGRDKMIFLTSRSLRPFPAWAEQLLAESLGKLGRGIVPVADPPPRGELPRGTDAVYVGVGLATDRDRGVDRLLAAVEAGGAPVLRFELASPFDLGREFFRWEFAVAACGAVLEVDPFDQPDVEHAKELARTAMADRTSAAPEAYGAPGGPGLLPQLDRWLASARPNDYVALQAFLAPGSRNDATLRRLASALRRRLGLAVTIGYGPRFLHSTGQLHKGGPPSGLFLQLVDEPTRDLGVPELDLTFGRIVRAQARGDLGALTEKHRRVLVVNVGRRPAEGTRALARLLAR